LMITVHGAPLRAVSVQRRWTSVPIPRCRRTIAGRVAASAHEHRRRTGSTRTGACCSTGPRGSSR
jgi:hypothetical protein